MFVFRPGRARRGAADLHRAAEGPGGRRRRAARFQHDLVERFRNVSVIDFREILDDDPRRDVEGHAGDHAWSAAWCCSAAADPDRRGGDDEVPARLRGGGASRRSAPTRGPSPGCCCSSTACSARWPAPSARSAPSALTWGVSRYALEIPWRVFAGEHVGGVARHGDAGRRHRRALEPRRPAEQAARDARRSEPE